MFAAQTFSQRYLGRRRNEAAGHAALCGDRYNGFQQRLWYSVLVFVWLVRITWLSCPLIDVPFPRAGPTLDLMM